MNFPFAFGWIPDALDARDRKYATVRTTATADLPDQIDLRERMPAVENQGSYSSCVAHAVTSALEALQLKAGKKREQDMSRMFVYWNARAMDNIQYQDGGCMIRSAIKSVADSGVCPESKWAYTKEHLLHKPGIWARWSAKKRLLTDYLRIDFTTLGELKAALAEGFTVVFGTVLFESFARVGEDGVIPMPDEATEHKLGRHAMLLCGYNDTHFLVQNSWGKNWGNHGYCSIPHAYFVKYAPLDADFWVIRRTTQV